MIELTEWHGRRDARLWPWGIASGHAADERSLTNPPGYRHDMSAGDLGFLSNELRSQARVDANGEVAWHVRHAPAVLSELAESGRVVLGLDVRDYDPDGAFFEIAWSVYEGEDPFEARDAALQAFTRDELPGEWALITWRS